MATWGNAQRILGIRLDQMGDVLMTTPALHALRSGVPGRRITLLTSSSGALIAPLLPDVDDVIVHDAPWVKGLAGTHGPDTDLALIDQLRERAFDAAVVFNVWTQNPIPAVMLAYLARIPLRAAYCREKVYGLLSDWFADPDAEVDAPIRHEVRRQLDLVAQLGALSVDERLRLDVPPSAVRAVTAFLAERGIAVGGRAQDRRWALLHPGATAESRRYPPEMFAAAASALVRRHGWQIVIAGGRSERALVDEVMAQMTEPAVRVDGDLSLPDFAALTSIAPVLIANNSGPAHIAAAVGTPVVSLYALTNPQHTPWLVNSRVLNHDVPCRNCLRSVCPMGHHLCLRGVPPEAVVDAALELVGDQQRRRGQRMHVLDGLAVGARA
jgi:lipopolysaccharide heptosyltransferase II